MTTESYGDFTTPNTTITNVVVQETSDLLNVIIPIVSVCLFLASVVITYIIDDPGIKTLKNITPEDDLKPISESDKNHLRYLAERKLYVDTKGHTFSAFTPHAAPEATVHVTHDHADNAECGRRRACSESHTPNVGEINSETQIILQHMLIRAGYPHNNADSLFSGNSIRSRPGFHNPFSSLKKSKATENETQKLEEDNPNSQSGFQC
ncbi:unnamed protein product [Trichobilharzia szidati]|nr:unnamed protein product [Trichobilharzia szidati]CAH8849431.1 unnamed protein product [Trichobilharzia szidati]CAH8849434.1 unnamed protein product [Trichobilharzia szidati]